MAPLPHGQQPDGHLFLRAVPGLEAPASLAWAQPQHRSRRPVPGAGHGPTSTLEHHRVDGRARMIRMPYIYQGHGFPVRARQDSVTGGGGRGERVHGLVDRPLGSR